MRGEFCLTDIQPIPGATRIIAAGHEFHKAVGSGGHRYWYCRYRGVLPKGCNASVRQSFKTKLPFKGGMTAAHGGDCPYLTGGSKSGPIKAQLN